jgi:hypothetical protein
MSVRPPAVALSLILLAGCSADREGSGTRPIVNEVAAQTLRDERLKMGTRFEIQLVVEDAEAGRAAIEAAYAEIDRVEDLLSEWRETSEISEVNRQAGRRAVVVGPDLFTVVERSIWAAEATGGAFDVTFAACGRLWSIRERRIPEEEAIAACLARVDYGRLELDPERSSIFVPDPDMRIAPVRDGRAERGGDRHLRRLSAVLRRKWRSLSPHPRHGHRSAGATLGGGHGHRPDGDGRGRACDGPVRSGAETGDRGGGVAGGRGSDDLRAGPDGAPIGRLSGVSVGAGCPWTVARKRGPH